MTLQAIKTPEIGRFIACKVNFFILYIIYNYPKANGTKHGEKRCYDIENGRIYYFSVTAPKFAKHEFATVSLYCSLHS